MPSRKPMKRGEWMLFLMPPFLLVAAYVARPLRQKLFPLPTPIPVPKPKPVPTPTLWETSFDSVPSILPSRDGKTIYTLGKVAWLPGVIRAWDAKSGKLLRLFSGVSKYRSSNMELFSSWGNALSEDGKRIAFTWDGQPNSERLGIYDTLRGARLKFISTKTAHTHPCFLSRSHTLFVGFDGRFEIWDTSSGTMLHRVSWQENASTASRLQFPVSSSDGKNLAVVRVEDSEGGNYSYANGRRDEIGLFSTRTWRAKRVYSWPNTTIRGIGFVENGRKLVVNSTTVRWAKSKTGNNSFYPTSSVRLLDLKTGRERVVRQLPVWRSYEHDMAISPDGRFFSIADSFTVYRSVGHRMIAAEKESSSIEIRDGRTGHKIASLLLPNIGSVRAMAFAPDNSVLYYDAATVKRWPRKKWKIGVTAITSP